MKQKENYLFYGSIILVLIILLGVFYLKNNSSSSDVDKEITECIANKTTLYISKNCGHCANQKEILGEHINKFNIVDCVINPKKCSEKNILSVPTWGYNDEKIIGVKTIKELKKITGCSNG
jgi:glutaredoxin